jgi:hypothetical protein
LHHGTYWTVGEANYAETVFEHNAIDGSVLTTVVPEKFEYWRKPVITADHKFLIMAGGSLLRTIDTTTNLKVDTGQHKASDVALCDDGTIVSAYKSDGKLATHNIDGAGQLTTLAAVDAGNIPAVACTPGSGFVVGSTESSSELRAFAISPALTQTVVDTLTLPSTSSFIVSLAFNPATSDLYLLQYAGELSVYTFDSNTGMFGALQASVDTDAFYSASYPQGMQFAYDKLFVHANDQLLVYDTALNLLSSKAIISGFKTAICVSEGVMYC